MALPNIINEINTIKSTYLPKSGGAFNKGSKLDFTGNDDEGYTRLNKSGGNGFFIENYDTASKIGSRLCLRSSIHSSYPGQFELDANDGVTKVVLKGNPNGTLTWGGNNVITSAGGKMSGALTKDGVAVSWKNILDTPSASFLYQNTYTGYTPALNLKTKDGRVGIGTYESYLALTYFLDTNTTNSANTQLNLLSNGTATIGGKQIVCVTYYRSGTSWYRKYTDGFIEQGGRFSYTLTNSGFTTLSFVTAFTSTNYQILGSGYRSDSSPNQGFATFKDFSTSSCNVAFWDDSTSNPGVINWYACGY